VATFIDLVTSHGEEGETKQKIAKSVSIISLVLLYKLLSVSPATSIIKRLILNKYWLL